MDNRNSLRLLTAKTLLNRKPMVMDKKTADIPKIFGECVLSYSKLKQMLPKNCYNDLMDAMSGDKIIAKETADAVAHVAKDWAVSMGATHFTHWFQPQTDLSAEKHDAFFSFDSNKLPVANLSASQLIQSEPDASSFPSGGTRSTFEARGYTAWDPTSPIFIVETPNGKTLCIPSVFISYNGEALDVKAPLVRSNLSMKRSSLRLLKLLGDKETKSVTVSIGAEQEYFLVDKAFHNLREDLLFCGRTLIGGWSPKGQEMEDHYFGSIPARVMAFMQETEYELFRLGIPCKTRHNEVAPSQFEFAPIFEEANIAADHNQLVMETMKKIAEKHNFAVLFHEKPFSKINGSGKHLNWSLATDSGENLLEPSELPHQNPRFLLFLVGIIKGIAQHGGALRAAIATHSNDRRLGANEAPPAIMSAFIGKRLQMVLDSIEKGTDVVAIIKELQMAVELNHLPRVKLDDCDRNRTSPFAFTGNKFEFRSAGSSQSIAFPLTVLNAAVGSGLDYVSDKLEKALAKEKDINSAALLTIKEIMPELKNIIFDGNNYSDEWKKEAEKRGLPILANTPEAYKWFKTHSDFLVERKIFTKNELEAKIHIVLERYTKAILIESSCLVDMIKTFVLPSAEEEISMRTDTCPRRKEDTALLTKMTDNLIGKIESLQAVHKKAKQMEGPFLAQAEYLASSMLPLFEEIHELSNTIEQNTRDYLWVLPKYREMLFLR
ncbi:MAG: glutamine synthetase III [bacterium]